MDREAASVVFSQDAAIADRGDESSRPYAVTALVLTLAVLYCFSHYVLGHLKPVHFLFTGLVIFLYFSHPKTRLFLLLALPFVIKDVLFDYLRYVPFEWLKPIHVLEPYRWEQAWFGFSLKGTAFLPHEFLFHFSHPFFVFVSGLVYYLNEPMAILFILLAWALQSRSLAGRYAAAFLVMNLLADFTYVLYPAAPPWYVAKYGFLQPLAPVMGDPAGLVRFDALLGVSLAKGFYGMSPVVFGAIPSMHAGFSGLIFLYSFQLGKKWAVFFGIYFLCMCFAALYLQHHYGIDLVVGTVYALIAYLFVEKWAAGAVRRTYGFLEERLVREGPKPFWGRF